MRTIQESKQIDEILDLLSVKPAGHHDRKTQLPKSFKICFAVLITSASASVIVAALAKIGWMPRASAMDWSYGLLAICQLSALTMSGSTAWSLPKEMNKPLAKVRITAIHCDHAIILQLRSFPSQVLEYLSERLQLEAEQLRSRVGMLVGSLDKAGIVPLIVGSAYTLWKLQHEANLKPSLIATGLAGLTILYAMGVFLMTKAHRADQLAQLLKLAASKDDLSPQTGPNL